MADRYRLQNIADLMMNAELQIHLHRVKFKFTLYEKQNIVTLCNLLNKLTLLMYMNLELTVQQQKKLFSKYGGFRFIN